jgi:hypothetical protein
MEHVTVLYLYDFAPRDLTSAMSTGKLSPRGLPACLSTGYETPRGLPASLSIGNTIPRGLTCCQSTGNKTPCGLPAAMSLGHTIPSWLWVVSLQGITLKTVLGVRKTYYACLFFNLSLALLSQNS